MKGTPGGNVSHRRNGAKSLSKERRHLLWQLRTQCLWIGFDPESTMLIPAKIIWTGFVSFRMWIAGQSSALPVNLRATGEIDGC
jgi:hypothetical protein